MKRWDTSPQNKFVFFFFFIMKASHQMKPTILSLALDRVTHVVTLW